MPNPAVDVDSWAGSACYPRSTFYPLSDGHSTLSRRITSTDFRLCSTCRSRSQAPLCACTLRSIANRSEGTLRAPPLLFWRRPPQSNYPPGTVPVPDNGHRLGPKPNQGGISTSTPPRLAPQFPSLPPILHRSCPSSISGYSKAPRGLFVLLRVKSIFTPISVSPGPLSRQCSSRYAFRAGRNLPDKEFRYLRTVIVTAAVHRGFSSKLRSRSPSH